MRKTLNMEILFFFETNKIKYLREEKSKTSIFFKLKNAQIIIFDQLLRFVKNPMSHLYVSPLKALIGVQNTDTNGNTSQAPM